MKKPLLAFIIFTLVSCKKEVETKQQTPAGNPVELGKEIFQGKGTCTACHLADQKVIGPSITEIAKIYKEKNGDMVAFLKAEANPIVDPSQYEVMKTNFAITKQMTDEELKALEAYFYSFLE